MPAKSDLVGRRFGSLVVIERVNPGEEKAWWLCRCDCGQTESVHMQRLPTSPKKAASRIAVTACRSCRLQWTCAHCGTTFVPRERGDRTCSEPCKQAQIALYRNAERYSAYYAAARLRLLADPARHEQLLAADRQQHRELLAQLTPEQRLARADKKKAKARENYAFNREAIFASRRAARALMSPEAKAQERERNATYRANRRAQKRLEDLLAIGEKLTDRSE